MKERKRLRRQIFVLTKEEKKAAACVLAAIILGLATKHYRETHPRPQQHLASKTHPARTVSPAAPTPSPDDADGD
ncbi:MAG: hypothetical protein ACR2NX_06625 [Chthoniobacterales bacterium]